MALQRAKLKGIVDLVFCIDNSGSMESCIEGLKTNVNSFVEALNTSNPQLKIDFRIGFCLYNYKNYNVLKFIDDPQIFKSQLESVNSDNLQEFTPGAIDFSISDFEWRPDCNKFMIVFTDEGLLDGYSDNYVADKGATDFENLKDKIINNKINLFYYGAECQYYEQFGKMPRGRFTKMWFDDSLDFNELLRNLGKTVSNSIESGVQIKKNADIKTLVYNQDGVNTNYLN